MVEHSGTGGDPHGVTRRVDRLEEVLARLSEESIRTQGAIGTLAKHLDAQAEALTGIAEKLDEQRTKRPELGALATWSLVILTIGALAFAPLMKQQERFHERLQHVESSVERINSNRFTEEDGRRLQDQIYNHLKEDHRELYR